MSVSDIARLIALEHEGRITSAELRREDWKLKADMALGWGHPWQRNVQHDPSRRIALLTGRGCGKSTTMQHRLERRLMLTEGARCLFVAPTREMAMELVWTPLKDDLERLQLKPEIHETSLRCTLTETRSTLRCVGADDRKQIEKYRGQPFHEVWIDEASVYDHKLLEYLVDRVIAPRLGDYRGVLGLGGTPGHILQGEFYEATRPGSERHRHWDRRETDEEAEYSLHTWTARDAAPFVPAIASFWEEALVQKAKKGWSDQHPVWMREYLGFWAADDTDAVFRYRAYTDDGAEWNSWNPKRDPVGVAILPSHLPAQCWRFVHGYDLGYSDPFALEVFAWNTQDRDRRLYHCFEHVQREMYPKAIAELLLGPSMKHEDEGGVIGRTAWPDGTAVDPASMGEAILRELSEVYGIKLDLAQLKDKFGAIELFNGDLIDGRIKILLGSELERQLIHNQWSRDDFGNRKRNKGQRDDAADAAVYARERAHHLFSEESPPQVKKRGEDAFKWRRGDMPGESIETPGEYDQFLDDSYWGS